MTPLLSKAYAYNDYMTSYAMRYTHNLEDAKDAVQSVYLHLLTRSNIEEVNDKTFGGYLRRTLAMELISQKQRNRETEELPQNVSTSDVCKDDKEFAGVVLKKALCYIPAKYKDIFLMYYNGMNCEMIFNRQTKYSHVCCIHNIINQYDPVLRKKMRQIAKKYL